MEQKIIFSINSLPQHPLDYFFVHKKHIYRQIISYDYGGND
jgi:hypothetical protein